MTKQPARPKFTKLEQIGPTADNFEIIERLPLELDRLNPSDQQSVTRLFYHEKKNYIAHYSILGDTFYRQK